jgi:hypothetical protein
MTTEESLATPSLNLLRRFMAVGLADPSLNPDVNPLEELIEKECTLVTNSPIFTEKKLSFLKEYIVR